MGKGGDLWFKLISWLSIISASFMFVACRSQGRRILYEGFLVLLFVDGFPIGDVVLVLSNTGVYVVGINEVCS